MILIAAEWFDIVCVGLKNPLAPSLHNSVAGHLRDGDN